MKAKYPAENIIGVLLAGGGARRMGGCDKCLLPLDSKPILEHVIERAKPQVGRLLLSTNSEAALFSRYGLPIVHDTVPGSAGPLAGVLAAMEWTQTQADQDYRWLASFPADSPFFPSDLPSRLFHVLEKNKAQIACAASGGRRSPLFALWSMDLMDDLAEALARKERKVGHFLERHRCEVLNIDSASRDPFFNINTVEDLKAARSWVAPNLKP